MCVGNQLNVGSHVITIRTHSGKKTLPDFLGSNIKCKDIMNIENGETILERSNSFNGDLLNDSEMTRLF